MPSRNKVDLEDVPEVLRKTMTFIPVDRVEQVWEAAMSLHINGGQPVPEAAQPAVRRGRTAAKPDAPDPRAGERKPRRRNPPHARKSAAKKR